nr:MAG TPA: hypothetical protein [Caudoviricetes sp.]
MIALLLQKQYFCYSWSFNYSKMALFAIVNYGGYNG